MDLDDGLGHWLAGLAETRATFSIKRTAAYGVGRRHLAPGCRFDVTLPACDRAVLAELRDRLGFGALFLSDHGAQRPARGGQVRLSVHRIPDCLRLAEALRRYPLRTRKRRQFEVWARAVEEIARGGARSDAIIAACKAELIRLRRGGAAGAASDGSGGDASIGADDRGVGEAPRCLCGCGRATRLITNSFALPHPDNPDFCSFVRGHSPRGMPRPRCLCGCGRVTSLLRHPSSRPHPDDPDYCSFVNGHQNRPPAAPVPD
jgi:hypothetical protein